MTHIGNRRKNNEDALMALESCGLFVVADGMGGHAAGEVASRLAVETVADFYHHRPAPEELPRSIGWERERDPEESRVIAGIKLANRVIFETAAANDAFRTMGTTIAMAHFTPGGSAYIGHVGDSRVYRLRAGRLTQLTEDHSLIAMLKREGGYEDHELAKSPFRNVLLRGLGHRPSVAVDVRCEATQVGDLYLLCSDGLTGDLSDSEIAGIIGDAQPDLQRACNDLVDACCRRGGRDNITALLIRCDR